MKYVLWGLLIVFSLLVVVAEPNDLYPWNCYGGDVIVDCGSITNATKCVNSCEVEGNDHRYCTWITTLDCAIFDEFGDCLGWGEYSYCGSGGLCQDPAYSCGINRGEFDGLPCSDRCISNGSCGGAHKCCNPGLNGYCGGDADLDGYIGGDHPNCEDIDDDCHDDPYSDPDSCWTFGGVLYERTVENYRNNHGLITCSGDQAMCAKCRGPHMGELCSGVDNDCNGKCYGGANHGTVCLNGSACPGGQCNYVDEDFDKDMDWFTPCGTKVDGSDSSVNDPTQITDPSYDCNDEIGNDPEGCPAYKTDCDITTTKCAICKRCSCVSIDLEITSDYNLYMGLSEPLTPCDAATCIAKITGPDHFLDGITGHFRFFGDGQVVGASCTKHEGYPDNYTECLPNGLGFQLNVSSSDINCEFVGSRCDDILYEDSDNASVEMDCEPSSEDILGVVCITPGGGLVPMPPNGHEEDFIRICDPAIYQFMCDNIYTNNPEGWKIRKNVTIDHKYDGAFKLLFKVLVNTFKSNPRMDPGPGSSAVDVLNGGAGVCRHFSNTLISVAKTMGIPGVSEFIYVTSAKTRGLHSVVKFENDAGVEIIADPMFGRMGAATSEIWLAGEYPHNMCLVGNSVSTTASISACAGSDFCPITDPTPGGMCAGGPGVRSFWPSGDCISIPGFGNERCVGGVSVEDMTCADQPGTCEEGCGSTYSCTETQSICTDAGNSYEPQGDAWCETYGGGVCCCT